MTVQTYLSGVKVGGLYTRFCQEDALSSLALGGVLVFMKEIMMLEWKTVHFTGFSCVCVWEGGEGGRGGGGCNKT